MGFSVDRYSSELPKSIILILHRIIQTSYFPCLLFPVQTSAKFFSEITFSL